MHFAYPLLHLETHPDLLVLGQLDDRDTHSSLARKEGHRSDGTHFIILALDLVEDRPDVEGGHLHNLVLSVFGLQDEVSLADLTVLDAFCGAAAGPAVLEVVHRVAYERNQPNPLAQELVVQYRSVFKDGH